MDPLFGTVIRGTFNLKLVGRREWTSGLISASRAKLNLGAGQHRDTERGLTKVNDALFPTRSLSSFSSHFLSSIICSFCWRRVSCMCCLSVCQRCWASSLLFGSTLVNSLSWEKKWKHFTYSDVALVSELTQAQTGDFLTPMLRRLGDLTGRARVFVESIGDW